MFWSKTFIPTLREIPQEAESVSHQLMLRAGLIRMLMAGAYSYLPLGLKVLRNIEKIIRQEMDASGAVELLLPALQPEELWVKSGRDKVIGEVMIRFVDRRQRNICLGPTHEEIITELVKNQLESYKQLPFTLYQIQTKFRDEIRPRFGLVRACEFIMKDAYSFDKDEAGLDKSYETIYQAYENIFKRCGLEILTVYADSGIMGGSLSHEFMVPAEKSGEDAVLTCPGCKFTQPFINDKVGSIERAGFTQAFNENQGSDKCPKCNTALKKINTLEVGHIFKLGVKYSSVLGANFLDAKGQLNPVIMGCYGIGVSRLIAAIIEQSNDSNGIIWPMEVSPYKVIILPLDVTNAEILRISLDIYKTLENNCIETLLDDRDERAGVKFKDADLIGIPIIITIGKEALKQQKIEVKLRKDKQLFLVEEKDVLARVKAFNQDAEISGFSCSRRDSAVAE